MFRFTTKISSLKKVVKLDSDSLDFVQSHNDMLFFLSFGFLSIYDANLETLKLKLKLGPVHGLGLALFVDPRCRNYMYIRDSFDNNVMKVFNANGFKLVGEFTVSEDLIGCYEGPIINGYMFFGTNKLRILNIECTDELNNSDDRAFMCQLNTFPRHLLKNPYKLPCDKLACLECICENYNLYLSKFTWCACGASEHQLKGQLVKSDIIEDSLQNICEMQIRDLRKKSSSKGTYTFSFSIALSFLQMELLILRKTNAFAKTV